MGRCHCSWDLVLLAVLHSLLLLAGSGTIYLRHEFSASDWPDIARPAFKSEVATFEIGMNTEGIATVAVVVAGVGAALYRKKALLLIEGVFVVLVLGGAVYLAVRALIINATASSWENEPDPVSDRELLLADSFNSRYCAAQRAFVCDHATLQQLLYLGVANGTLTDGSASGSGEWAALGELCLDSPPYESLASLSRWVEDHCSFTAMSIDWCDSVNSTTGDSSSSRASAIKIGHASPYAHCRADLLSQTMTWTEALGIAWTVHAGLLLLLLVCVALLIQSRANADAVDLDDVSDHFPHDPDDEYTRISKV